MAQAIPESLRNSPGLQFVVNQGWDWREATNDQVQIEKCPFCKAADYKFYMGVMDPQIGTKDGLYFCHHASCQKSGNLRTLQEHLGLRVKGVESRSEWAGKSDRKPDALPDVEMCHAALLGDAGAMDYLTQVRGFSVEIIKRQRLGLKERVYFREAGEHQALVYPYLVDGSITFAKYRTLPPTMKDFITPTGWDAQLYNAEILKDGLNEIIFVEGEANTLSCMSNGIENVVGAPGAGVKKATWIEALDRVAPSKIYVFYDNDKAGNKGAQDLASRIGVEKCLKLVLPEFYVEVQQADCKRCKGTGMEELIINNVPTQNVCDHKRKGKDVNEWFMFGGGSKEALDELKANAQLFDVNGVTSSGDALQQLEDILAGKTDLAPTYISQWPSLNRLIGFENGDVIDILAPEKVGKTTLGMNLIDHMCSAYGEDGLIVCLEMTQDRLARKWVAMMTGFEDFITTPGTEQSKQQLAKLKDAVVVAREAQQNRHADLYFAYPQMVKTPEDVYKLIRDCIRRYGVKWVMFDNLQLLADNTLENKAHRTTHLSQISKGFAKLAKDYGIKLIRILQPRQIEDGQMIQSRHTDGSSQIAKDCDGMITMWRSQVGTLRKSEWEKGQGDEETEASFDPKCHLTVALSRYSSGGSCNLYFDGARSQVRELDTKQKAAMAAAKVDYNNVIPMEQPAQPLIKLQSVLPGEIISI